MLKKEDNLITSLKLTAKAPEKMVSQKEAGSSSNQFSGAFAVSFREGNPIFLRKIRVQPSLFEMDQLPPWKVLTAISTYLVKRHLKYHGNLRVPPAMPPPPENKAAIKGFLTTMIP